MEEMVAAKAAAAKAAAEAAAKAAANAAAAKAKAAAKAAGAEDSLYQFFPQYRQGTVRVDDVRKWQKRQRHPRQVR